MVSLSEMVTPASPCSLLGTPGDVTFAASTFLAYLLWEELELPPAAKPPNMVFVFERRVL